MHPWHLHAECSNWFSSFWIACVASCEAKTRDILFKMNESRIIIMSARNVTNGNNRPIHKQHLTIFDNVGPQEFAETVYHEATEIIISKLISFLKQIFLKFDKKQKLKSS